MRADTLVWLDAAHSEASDMIHAGASAPHAARARSTGPGIAIDVTVRRAPRLKAQATRTECADDGVM